MQKLRKEVLLPFMMAVLATTLLALFAASLANADEQVEVTLRFTGLEDLGPGWAYEGWLIVDGTPVSSGGFTVDSSGVPSTTSFTVAVSDPSKVTAFVLTIEPVPDADPAPSAVHVLGGDFVNGMAELRVGHGAALGDDFSSAAGSYILNAPSGGEGASYTNGVWWLDPAAGPGPALDLPTLSSGWMYEGWVVGTEGPITTGRFTSISGADSDGAGPAGGPNEAPPFPGQDFVDPAKDLTAGYAAVISIEPEPDNSPAPFTFKPLVDASIDDVGAGTLQSMENNAGAFPTGAATLAAQAPVALPKTGVGSLDSSSEGRSALPWILGGIGAVALLALSFTLRRRHGAR